MPLTIISFLNIPACATGVVSTRAKLRIIAEIVFIEELRMLYKIISYYAYIKANVLRKVAVAVSNNLRAPKK